MIYSCIEFFFPYCTLFSSSSLVIPIMISLFFRPQQTSLLCLSSLLRMNLYPSVQALYEAWWDKRWMDYGWVPWLDANTFYSTVIDAYADLNRYILKAALRDWLSSFTWQHFFITVTNRIGPSYLSTFLRLTVVITFHTFWISLGTQAWLLGYKLHVFSRGSTRVCSLSLSLWIFHTSAEVVVGGRLFGTNPGYRRIMKGGKNSIRSSDPMMSGWSAVLGYTLVSSFNGTRRKLILALTLHSYPLHPYYRMGAATKGTARFVEWVGAPPCLYGIAHFGWPLVPLVGGGVDGVH